MIELDGFLTKESFSEKIEELVHKDGYTYFEAVLVFADSCDKEPQEMISFYSQSIMDKVRKSATDLGYYTSNEGDLEELSKT